jgi:hypothetical protein
MKLAYAGIALAGICAVSPPAFAQPSGQPQGQSQFTLACHLRGQDGSERDESFYIDENDSSKLITDTTIDWRRNGGNNQVYHIHINRITGFIRISTREFPNLMVGKCVKAERRLF